MLQERGLAGPILVAPGTVDQLNEFLDQLSEVPREKVGTAEPKLIMEVRCFELVALAGLCG